MSVAHARFNATEIDTIVRTVKAKIDAHRPEHLRLVPHAAEHVEQRVRDAARRMGCGQGLAFLLADYAYCAVKPSESRGAVAQATRIYQRSSKAGLRLKPMSEARVSQLRTQAREAKLLVERHGKARGGRGLAADYELCDALAQVYAVGAASVLSRAGQIVTGRIAAVTAWALKASQSLIKPFRKATQTLNRTDQGEAQVQDSTTVPPPPSASSSRAATSEDVLAIFSAVWQARYGMPYVPSQGDSVAAINIALNALNADDLTNRIEQFMADDGDDACCLDSEERLLSGRSDRRRHRCRAFAGYQHPLWLLNEHINVFGIHRPRASA